MRKEESFGIIPLRQQRKEWEVLLVEHLKGHWSFPKGHLDEGESPQMTAERELMEETGLEVEKYLFSDVLKENYFFFDKDEEVRKTAHYFVAMVQGQETPQPEEIKTCKWFSLQDGASACTYKNTRELVLDVIKLLEGL